MNRYLMAIASSPAPSSPSCNAMQTQSWQLLASRTPLLDDVDVDILGVIAIREYQDGRYYRASDGEVVQTSSFHREPPPGRVRHAYSSRDRATRTPRK